MHTEFRTGLKPYNIDQNIFFFNFGKIQPIQRNTSFNQVTTFATVFFLVKTIEGLHLENSTSSRFHQYIMDHHR